jgi:RNA polymerase sigma-70 factor (ECF subfamily)
MMTMGLIPAFPAAWTAADLPVSAAASEVTHTPNLGATIAESFAQSLVGLRPRLMAYAVALTRDRDDALDLVQDTMLRALEKQRLFIAGTDLGAWVVTLMHNLHVSGMRRAARRGPLAAFEEALTASVDGDQEALTFFTEAAHLIEHLSAKRRRSLILYGMGFRCEEIAERLEIPIGSVKSGMVRGRAALSRALDADAPPGSD